MVENIELFLHAKITFSRNGVKRFSSINDTPLYIVIFILVLKFPDMRGQGCGVFFFSFLKTVCVAVISFFKSVLG